MYKTLLVPLDGSGVAEAILPHVTELASRYEGEVVLLQVMELPHLAGMTSGAGFDALQQVSVEQVQAQVREAQVYLEQQVATLQAVGIRGRWLIEFGPVVAGIIRTAQTVNADLIAMASHGRGGQSDVYYGSVAAGVLQRIDRPLLIVRGQ